MGGRAPRQGALVNSGLDFKMRHYPLKSCVDPFKLFVLRGSIMMIRTSDIASVFFLSH
jgi:hypothetical protein